MMDGKENKPLIRVSFKYTIIFLLIILFFQLQILSILFSVEPGSLTPPFLLLPLLILASFFFASEVIDLIFVGKIVMPLSRGLKLLGGALSFGVLLASPPMPEDLRFFSVLLSIGMVVMVAHFTLGMVIEESKQKTRAILSTITILSIGLIIRQATFQYFDYLRLDIPILIGSGIASLLVFLGLFVNHTNIYISYISKKIKNNEFGAFLIILSITLYGFYFRNILISSFGSNASPIVIFEWISICTVSFLALWRVRKYVSASIVQPDVHGDWNKHHQELEFVRDISLEGWSSLVDGFVKNGEKDLFSIQLTELLMKNNVKVGNIRDILSPLINYQEKELGSLSFTWNQENLVKNNLKKRQKIIDDIMSGIVRVIG